MEKMKKRIAKVILIFMMCNFFIVPVSNVSANSNNVVIDYISLIEDKSYNIDSQITSSKNSFDYIESDSYKYAVGKLEKRYNLLNDEYNDFRYSLGDSLSVRQILSDSNSPLLEVYNEKIVDDEIVSFDNIKDIFYIDAVTGKEILISGDVLAELIESTYFNEYYVKYNDLNVNYRCYLNDYRKFYDEVIGDYNDTKSSIDSYVYEVNDFILSEQLVGNKPVINNTVTKFDSYINELNMQLDDVLDSGYYNDDFDAVLEKANFVKDKFYEDNADITLDLIKEIEDFTSFYERYKKDLEDLFANIGTDFLSIDYSLVNELDSGEIKEFINEFEKGICLEEDYQVLINKIDNYLDRRPSEEEKISNYLSNLNEYYNILNESKLLNIYNNFVDNANSSDEDIIDVLLSYKGVSTFSDEYKYLRSAKNNFYSVSLVDDSEYKVSEVKGYLVINGRDAIKKDSFVHNLDFNGKSFEIMGTSNILDKNTALKLYDREGNYLRSLNVVIKNDVNGDGLVNSSDVSLLKNKVLYQEFTKYDRVSSDINDDNVLNINDVVFLNSILKGVSNDMGTTRALFKVLATQSKDKIVYDVYLKTDGSVHGFEFDVKTSTNLKLVNTSLFKGVSQFDNNDTLRLVGLGNYKDDCLVASFVYEKNKDSKQDVNFIIENGVITFDNLEYRDDISYKNSVKYDDEKLEENLSNNETIAVVNLSNNMSLDSSNQELKNFDNLSNLDDSLFNDINDNDQTVKKSKISEKELDESDIIWGNVIKVAIIVLLGALIIYFLNKDTEVDFSYGDKKSEVNSEDDIISEEMKEISNDDKDSSSQRSKEIDSLLAFFYFFFFWFKICQN